MSFSSSPDRLLVGFAKIITHVLSFLAPVAINDGHPMTVSEFDARKPSERQAMLL